MKKVQPIDLGMTGYDELFMDDEERKVNALPRIFEIPIELIDDFPDHPFQVRMDEDMQQLVESVKERGLITPVILRTVNSPKTRAGTRVIPITQKVVEAFEMEKEYQKEAGIVCSAHIDGYTDFVFLNPDGRPHNPKSLNKALNRIVRDCNYKILDNYHGEGTPEILPHVHAHLLRHCFTTRMVESGIGPAALKELLGHADITMTYNIYTHLTDETKANDVSVYEAYIEKAME